MLEYAQNWSHFQAECIYYCRWAGNGGDDSCEEMEIVYLMYSGLDPEIKLTAL